MYSSVQLANSEQTYSSVCLFYFLARHLLCESFGMELVLAWDLLWWCFGIVFAGVIYLLFFLILDRIALTTYRIMLQCIK